MQQSRRGLLARQEQQKTRAVLMCLQFAVAVSHNQQREEWRYASQRTVQCVRDWALVNTATTCACLFVRLAQAASLTLRARWAQRERATYRELSASARGKNAHL